MTEFQKYRISKRFDLRIEEFGGFLFDREKNIILNVNKVGLFILLSLDNGLTIPDITTRLKTKYANIDKTAVVQDVEKFIESNLKEGIIEMVGNEEHH